MSAQCREECDACEFVSSDLPDCKVYGKLNGNLIAWNRSPQSCLDAFNIKRQAVDPAKLSNMFPNSDGTGGNINAFVNFLRFDVGSVVYGIRAGFPAFFTESAPGIVVFKEQITVLGVDYFCRTSESSCWNALKDYFAESPGTAEMAQVGVALYAEQRNSLELEQSLSRIRMCNVIDGDEVLNDASTVCQGIFQQMETERANNPGLACSSFAFGPGSTEVCSRNGGGGGSNSASISLVPMGTALVALVLVLITQ